MRTLLPVCILTLAAGCCTVGDCRKVLSSKASSCGSPLQGVVFVANGSGDFRTVSKNLAQVVVESSVPLRVDTVAWSHGFGRYLIDHVDHPNHLAQGLQLAQHVGTQRQACPGQRIYLIGHSAGCAVILAAAEALPPDSVDGIVLLAPSVCVEYDLRRALRAARHGIDVFHSDRDSVILGLGMRLVRTADRRCRTAAGQNGFTPVLTCATDADLYGKLRQHPWDPVVAWCGNDGGHYGTNGQGFLRAYVLPLLQS